MSDSGTVFLVVWLLATPVLMILWAVWHRRLKRQRVLTAEMEQKAAELTKRFRSVINADDEAEKIQAYASEYAEETRANAAEEARKIIAEAKKQAETIQRQHADMQAAVNSVLHHARQEAASLLASARQQANAMTAEVGQKLHDAIDYEKAVKALRNKIEGYGDEYLLPPQALLDQLAEDFGFDEAGQALKRAREHSRLLVKTAAAATCEYAETFRRTTAIAFVLDAFNGKVDSILARMKHDNAGKLMQEAKDAFALVNANGKAFRDARILPEYLLARLEEIKWGAVALELREKAREEQRAIKEQMREEERARREYERALREAGKEEEKARLALEKARLAYAQAENDAARQKLEERIKEFEEQLSRAKEKEAQAVSMAQLTKSGHVYIISNIGSFGDGILKIGMTRRLDPMDRVKELGDASVPFAFDVHAIIYNKDAPALEAELHRRFNTRRVNKVNYRKEFFRVTPEEIRNVAAELGLEMQITLLAQALEYKESLAIEKLPEAEQEAILAGAIRKELEDARRLLLEAEEGEEEAA